MKIKGKNIIFCLLLFVNCTAEVKKSAETSISLERRITAEIRNDLQDWNLTTGVAVKSFEDALAIDIIYLNSKDSFFLDKYSNELIVKTLIHKHYEKFKKYNLINLSLEFEDYPEILTFYLDKQKMKAINVFFVDNYYANVVYSLKSFNYENVITFNSVIKFITNNARELTFEGNYWELLQSVSFSKRQESETERINNTILFVLMIQMVDNVYSNLFPEGTTLELTELIEQNNINKAVLDMSYDELKSYFRDR